MTLGEKIKKVRIQNVLTQEEFAKKLCVSRSAVAKWESNKGIPDIENLKIISKTLDVSIDYLVSNSDVVIVNTLKQIIDLDSYPNPKGNGLREDLVVLEYYHDAKNIWQLSRKRKLSGKEKVMDFFFPGVQYTSDHWRDPSVYYLIEQKEQQFLVNVRTDFIISQKLMQSIYDKPFEIGDEIFTKTYRKLK